MQYSHTVVGVFGSDFDSQDAVDELLDKGFSRKDIDVNNRRDVNASSTQSHDVSKQEALESHHHESGITKFFKTIFGDNNDDADKYSKLAIAGGSVVTVYTHTADEAIRAMDILDSKGAVNVDDHTAEYSTKQPIVYPGVDIDFAGTPSSGNSKQSTAGTTTTDMSSENELDQQIDEDLNLGQRREEQKGPGVGSNPTGGNRSKSRMMEWRGEASSRLRDDRNSETKIGW